jgi:hypothetical protein
MSSRIAGMAILVVAFTISVHAQSHDEQSHFSVEQQIVPIEHSVAISGDLMRVLKADSLVTKVSTPCLKAANLTIEELPPSWFVASPIHLDGADELDWIILARNQCLDGANVGPFWIASRTARGYWLVLSTYTRLMVRSIAS